MSALAQVAGRVVALRPGRRVRVAVDGGSCTGKTTFADALAELVAPHRPVVRTTVDRFHRPRAERYRRGPGSPVGCYEDTYDHTALHVDLLDPFAAGAPHRLGVWDWMTDRPARAPRTSAAPDAVLLVDGVFLQRPELAPAWDLVVLLVASQREVLRRAVTRDAVHFGDADAVVERYRTRYLPAEALYAQQCDPSGRADVVVSNEDPRSPVLLRG